MKKTILILICLCLSITACTSFRKSLRNAEATEVAANTFATQTAQAPTATPTPSPTPTWTLTPTSPPTTTPTPTPSPSPTATATPTPTPFPLPHGWIDYGSDGFHIALPESWEIVDVDQEGIDAVLDLLERLDTDWAEGMTGQISAEQMQESLKFWAMEPKIAGVGFPTLNVQRQTLPIAMDVFPLMQQLEATYEQMGVEVVTVEYERRVNDLTAGRISIRFSTSIATLRNYQYVFVDGRDLWIVNMGVDDEVWFEYEPLFAQIGGTFRLD